MAIYIPSVQGAPLQRATTDLYPVPAGRAAIVKTISIVNRNSAPVAVDVGYYDGATFFSFVGGPVYVANGSQLLIKNEITLGAGKIVRVVATAFSMLDAAVFAIERDV